MINRHKPEILQDTREADDDAHYPQNRFFYFYDRDIVVRI